MFYLFSDPIAEGPVVQEANVRALSVPGGCTTDMVFDMLERVSKKVSVPLVFLTYLNPVFSYGYDRFCARCQEVGMNYHCIGTLPELFDGNPPFHGRGALSFAMNVAEVLRVNKLLSKYDNY